MYAVIQTGGKQYKVEPGDTVNIETINGSDGDSVEFDEVLLIENDGDVNVGTPLIPGAKVKGTILGHDRGKKLIVFKLKRRKDYRRKNGHRQNYTAVKIDSVLSA